MEIDISTIMYVGTAIMVALSLAVIFTVVILHRKLQLKSKEAKTSRKIILK